MRLLSSFPIRLFSSAASSSWRPLKRLPAGVTDVAALANPRDNLFYVDKASFIPDFEQAANVSVMLRPKRWGKSVFLNMIGSYYDAANAAAPVVHVPMGDTQLAHSFTILKLDVANVARALSSDVCQSDLQARAKAALDAEVYTAVKRTVYRYSIPGIDMTQSPTDLLVQVGGWAGAGGAPLFILVDEYDAVLRTISSGAYTFSALSRRQGPLREFFGRFKYMLDSSLASRVFMTGEWHGRSSHLARSRIYMYEVYPRCFPSRALQAYPRLAWSL